MSFRDFLFSVIPPFIENRIHILKEKWRLSKIDQKKCKPKNLTAKKSVSVQSVLKARDSEELWNEFRRRKQFGIEDARGGINPGDRKAVFFLVSKLKPSSVLEVGTHIGASTVSIASALKQTNEKSSLTTVDVFDVNSSADKRWLDYGMKYSPLQMVNDLELTSTVNFVTDSSLNFADNCEDNFDFIFLDGNHRAQYVYQEIPKMLKLLNPNGVILLHDYYPDLKPLWSNNKIIPGPYLATERLIKEGANMTVLPLGKLPWPTKLNSNISSLALVVRDE